MNMKLETIDMQQDQRPPIQGRRNERGLTLIEIMVVLTILGIMGTIVAVNVLGSVGDAKASTTVQSIANIEQALTMFKLRYSRYPNGGEGLAALVNPPVAPNGTQSEPLLKEEPKDGWGVAFQYFQPATSCNQPYEIRSLGGDGVEGGSGSNADVSSCPAVGAGQ